MAELSREEFFRRATQSFNLTPKEKPEYFDTRPRLFELKISLVDYFELVTRLKADHWQRDFCTRLENAALNRYVTPTKTIIHAESQLGKSVILAQVYPAWLIGHDPLHRVILATYNLTKSVDHSKAVLNHIQKPEHKEIFFDDACRLWIKTQEKWSVAARSIYGDGQYSFTAVGLQSGVTGRGFDTLIIDDPYASAQEAFSQTINHRLHQFWTQDITPRLGEHANVFAMFHRYHVNDFAGWLLDKGIFDYWRYATVADGDYVHQTTGQVFKDPLNREEGQYVCPERRPPSFYRLVREDALTWNSLFQGRPTVETGAIIEAGKVQIIEQEEAVKLRSRFVGEVCAWDFAATENAGDYTVGLHGAVLDDGSIVFLNCFKGRVNPANRMEMMKEAARTVGSSVVFRIPIDPASAGKFEAFFIEKELFPQTVVAKQIHGSKVARATVLAQLVNSGQVRMVRADWNNFVLEQWRNFDRSLVDDAVDAGADAAAELYDIWRGGLVIRQYNATRSLISRSVFNRYFGLSELNPQLPDSFNVFACLHASTVPQQPFAAVVIARPPKIYPEFHDTLFVLAEYKSVEKDYLKLFEFLHTTLQRYKPNFNHFSWATPESEPVLQAFNHKLPLPVRIFTNKNANAGIAELNWYLLPKEHQSPFDTEKKASGLFLVVDDNQLDVPIDSNGLYHLRQEVHTWGYDSKGNPLPTAPTLNCLRVLCYAFRTIEQDLTPDQEFQLLLPPEVKTILENKEMTDMSAQIKRDFALHVANQLRREIYQTDENDTDLETAFTLCGVCESGFVASDDIIHTYEHGFVHKNCYFEALIKQKLDDQLTEKTTPK